MGTNYYARIIPSHERKEKLKSLIDSDDFGKIKEEVSLMYGRVGEYDKDGGEIHLGKHSGGWKFLWNANQYRVDEGHYDKNRGEWISNYVIHNYYEPNKKSITEFLNRDDVRIFNEYGEEFTFDEFVNATACFEENPVWGDGKPCYDAESYVRDKMDGYNSFYCHDDHQQMFTEMGFDVKYHEFKSDGLRFSTSTEFS